MKPVETRGATHNYQPPANWDEKKDGACGDLKVRAEHYGERKIIQLVSTWRPTAVELAHLNRGGVIEMALLTNVQPPCYLSVVDPVGEVIVDDRHGTPAITINEEAHGDGV